MIIGVCGGSKCTPQIAQRAESVGKAIAEEGAILICGGLGGVMEAAAKGAKQAGGTVIGVLPGYDKHDANPYIDIPIVTGLSHGRNIVIVRSSDGIIAIDGKYGTLSEISFALVLGIPVVGVDTWEISEDIVKVKDPVEAVKKVISLIKQ